MITVLPVACNILVIYPRIMRTRVHALLCPLIQQHDAKVLPIACDSGYAYGVAIHSIITQHHTLLG